MDPQKWKKIRGKVKEKTDSEFATEASSLTRFTDEEIKAIAPSIGDREKLAQLMEIVSDATKSNREKAEAIKNIAGLADIAVRIVPYLV
jgi:DNA repair ATPase RecN